MLLTLVRKTFAQRMTLGMLLIDRNYFCDTIEPPKTPNPEHPKGCIPEGWYQLTLTYSPKFDRLLPLVNMVPGFEGIRIHAGNNFHHTAGCILVGECEQRRGCYPDGDNPDELTTLPVLYHSKAVENELTQMILKAQKKHEPIYIDITDSERYIVERNILDRVLYESAVGY